MELFGYDIQTIYLFGLVVSGICTLLLILFGDVLEGIFPESFSPTLVFSFLTFLSASGYIFEKILTLNSFIILSISLVLALILVTLLNVFVLIPLSSAEESITFREEDLKGRVGKVITSIPVDGFGEVVIDGISGTIAMPAKSYKNEPVPYDEKVLVIDVKESVLYVLPYSSLN
ncbi:NfeD family protein [Ferdinandcohnia quinoae]|uniref:NfeD family protein n=1 Tax=Fredinandcohnia quinoae TaxID=2918902 RepID=A0AAW5E807_9BACI|nr:NfeD family protein [Fredinandcohnia sp. SECRCQ15]MCH1627064.1 NfeD family protein [Fredinandcohnia sp. SECRCQ15]